MCGRYSLTNPTEALSVMYPELHVPDLEPRYNIAPTQQVTCIRQNDDSDLELASLRWGLIPFWGKDTKMGARMINARSETVASKPSFRAAFKKRRCLVIADGYFEWKKIGAEKQPFYMTVGSAENPHGFGMAGIWECWKDEEKGEVIESCSILTTDAAPSLAALHDRMPVVLDTEDHGVWLSAESTDSEKLQSLLHPATDGFFQSVPVSKTVNNVRNQGSDCVTPVNLES